MKTPANRFGLILFAIYLTIYAGFVLINAIAPSLMESTPVAGLNLAILYGFGLIITAFVLSIFYGIVSGQRDRRSDNDGGAA